MDENQFEIAERLEQAQRDSGLARARLHTAPQQHPDFDGENCVRCDTPIPPGRLAMRKVRCVPCQEIMDRNHRR